MSDQLLTLRRTFDERLSALEAGLSDPDQCPSLESLILDLTRVATEEAEAAARDIIRQARREAAEQTAAAATDAQEAHAQLDAERTQAASLRAEVAALTEKRKRLPFAIEVVGFGDEEGVRFGTTMLGSRALAGTLDASALEARDARGVTVKEALRGFGLEPAGVDTVARRKGDVLAYVELAEGPRLMTNIVGCPQTPEALQLDMKVAVTFTKMNDTISLPLFEPAKG